MSRFVEVPELGGTVEFPDEMTPDEMSAAIRANLPKPEPTREPGGLLRQAGIGITQGLAQLGQQGNALLQASANIPLSPLNVLDRATGGRIGGQFQRASENAGELSAELEQLGTETEGPRLARRLGAGAISIAPALAAAPLGIPAAIGASALQSFGGVYADAQRAYQAQGMSPEEAEVKARIPAIAGGLATAAITALGGKIAPGVEGWTQVMAVKGFRPLAASILKNAGAEASEEAVDQLSQAVISRFSYNPKMTLPQALTEAAEAFVVGGVLGGGMAGLRQASSPAAEQAIQRDQVPMARLRPEPTSLPQQPPPIPVQPPPPVPPAPTATLKTIPTATQSFASNVLYEATNPQEWRQADPVDLEQLDADVGLLEEKLKRGKLTPDSFSGTASGVVLSTSTGMGMRSALTASPNETIAALRKSIDAKKAQLAEKPKPASPVEEPPVKPPVTPVPENVTPVTPEAEALPVKPGVETVEPAPVETAAPGIEPAAQQSLPAVDAPSSHQGAIALPGAPLAPTAPQSPEVKLAGIVNESIAQEQERKKAGLGISPTASTRPADIVLGSEDLRSANPKVEARWQAAVKDKPGILSKISDSLQSAWRSITREYADLDPRKFPREIDTLRRLRASKNASARITVDVLRGITKDLGPKQYSVFNRVVVLEDLLKDVEGGELYAGGKELPYGYTDGAELKADLEKFKAIADATPQIKEAIKRRTEFMDSLRRSLVDRGFLPETILEDPRYFHHQVLFYLNAKNAPSGSKSFREWFSGWQKSRTGSSRDYNRQYIEAEAEVIADAFNKMALQDLQAEMKKVVDLTPQLKALAEAQNAADTESPPVSVESLIPKTHTKWQPKKGNIFYPAQTVSEKAMEDYLNGIKDLLADDFKEALVLGGKRETWIVPKELAKVLDNLTPPQDKFFERLASAGISGWKQWILMQPLRFLKYEINNMSGDLDFLFAANPRIFKEFKQAAKDMRQFHIKRAAMTGDIKEAVQAGVIGSGWRASELPEVGSDEFFYWLTGEKPKLMKRYMRFVGKWNDAREDTGRLAAYRFALKEWRAGKPFYGASVPSDVNALDTPEKKAAKVAREILIDYGRETEFGNYMRKKVMPFFRWMHGNFARYVQLMRNIPVQEGSAKGRLAGVAALKVSARMAFAYMLINLWNHLAFPDEEEELSDSERRQLHLVTGRDEFGNIQTIRFQGALSDLLGWVGLEDLPQDIQDLMKGNATAGDKMENAYEAAIGRAVNSTSPFYKAAAEIMTGRDLYPNPLEPRPIRDKGEKAASVFGLQMPYRWLAGKPMKPFRREIASIISYSVDPGEAAYNTTRHMAMEWKEEKSGEQGSIIPSARSNALYYYKQAVRFGDKEAAKKFLAKYYELGGKKEGLSASIKKSHPLSFLSDNEKTSFLKTLSPDERAVVDRAIIWFKKVY